jgi:hypothetical protein
MSYMFCKAGNFDQSLEKWDVRSDTVLTDMFTDAYSIFDTFPHLKSTPNSSNWKKHFYRAKPTKAAQR